MSRCVVCSRPLRPDEAHRTACHRCEHHIRAWLRELPLQLPILEVFLHPSAPRPGTGRPGPGGRPAPPVRADVLNLLGPGADRRDDGPDGDQSGPRPIAAVLGAWIRFIAERRPAAPPTGPQAPLHLTRWIATHIDWAVRQPWIADLHRELRDLVTHIRRITGVEPRRRPSPLPCPDCSAFALVATGWANHVDHVECAVCGRLLSPAAYEAHATAGRTAPGPEPDPADQEMYPDDRVDDRAAHEGEEGGEKP
ncbi:hypothetical protein ACQEV4_31115 [Streptomyces shenzhenensis]|uniref:hypothetical protein n=1 Tax=Streptomyces shenzhenensis TaxID=943815 RepID=UPI003D8B84BD